MFLHNDFASILFSKISLLEILIISQIMELLA